MVVVTSIIIWDVVGQYIGQFRCFLPYCAKILQIPLFPTTMQSDKVEFFVHWERWSLQSVVLALT